MFALIVIFASISTNLKIKNLNKMLVKSNNYLSSIKNNSELIRKYKIVKVDLLGAGSVPNPWYRQTGYWFQKKMNLQNKWYIFTDNNSKLYEVRNDFHYDEVNHNSKIKIFDRNKINDYKGLLLKFDNSGKLIELVR